MIEKQVVATRTIWIWECCEDRDVATEKPGRERRCPECREWSPWQKETYTGPDTF